jgi:hypothetical protein
MTFPHLSRRQLMHILTVGAGALPFARNNNHWGMPVAHAQGDVPRRFVYFNTPHGVLDYQDFVLNGGSGSNFQFGAMTKPLEKVKQHVTILDNVEMVKTGGGGCTHNIGMCQMTTGAAVPGDDPNTDQRSTGISIDHLFRKEIGVKKTPGCPSLLLSVMGLSYSFNDSFRRVGAIEDPMQVYNTYLMGLTQPGTSQSLQKRLRTRKHVLDAVAKDVVLFQKTLPAEARARADVKLDLIQSLSARVDGALNMPAPSNSCQTQKPVAYNSQNSAEMPRTSQYLCDMLLTALACDVTRVGMLGFLGTPHAGVPMNYAPVNRPDLHCHAASHEDIAKDGGKAFRTVKSMMFGYIADFTEKLSKIPEPVTGGSMLDNTVIFVGTDIGRGHTQSGLQLLVIGGKNLGIKTGQLLRLGGAREPGQGVRINRVLVSLKNAMGIPGDTFNVASGPEFRGPCPGLSS